MSKGTALFITPIMPSDRGNGLAMRAGFFLDTYAQRFDIDLAVVPLAGAECQSLTPFVAERVRRAAFLQPEAPNTHFTLITRLADSDARLAAFRQYARPSIIARLGAEVERALLAFAGDNSYALVHVSRLYLASLAHKWIAVSAQPRPYLVLDCDEDDANTYRHFAQLYRRWGCEWRARWAEAEASAFEVLAESWLGRFDLVLAASSSEARLLGARSKGVDVTVTPNAAPVMKVGFPRRCVTGTRRDILFIGNMSYLPNVDAVLWFAKRIWPKLRPMVHLTLRFIIAGARPTQEVVALGRHPGIIVVGRVDDVAPLYQRAAIAVIPIRAGGGTRIKLIESAKYRLPMVATRFGASGTEFRAGHEILLADTEHDFATSCARLLTDCNLATGLARRALLKAGREYDAKRLAARLLGIIGE